LYYDVYAMRRIVCQGLTGLSVGEERQGLVGRILVGLVKAEDKEEDYHVLEPWV
jgi:hypothetical protein